MDVDISSFPKVKMRSTTVFALLLLCMLISLFFNTIGVFPETNIFNCFTAAKPKSSLEVWQTERGQNLDKISSLEERETVQNRNDPANYEKCNSKVGCKAPTPVTTKKNGTKLILFWTHFVGSETVWWGLNILGNQPFKELSCEYQDCELTHDKARVREADMLLFRHGEDWPNWPPVRFPHQYYAHVMQEPPGPGQRRYMVDFNGKINITIGYRRDADVYNPYNQIVKVNSSTKAVYKARFPLEDKKGSICWLISHCDARSHRDEYLNELRKYVDIDVYGKCGNFSCPRELGNQCFQRFQRKYKFYLGFESNMCKDYATEKFFNPLRYELVPIVLGLADYDVVAPPHSVINARDFPSPRLLAQHLGFIGSNATLYYKYFEWKAQYAHGNDVLPLFFQKKICTLCEILHKNKPMPAREDYVDWWFSSCDNDIILKMKQNNKW